MDAYELRDLLSKLGKDIKLDLVFLDLLQGEWVPLLSV